MTISLGSIKKEIDQRLANTSISSLNRCQLENACNIINAIPVERVTALPASPTLYEGNLLYCDGATKAYYFSKQTAWTTDTNTKGIESSPIYGVGINCCGNLADPTLFDCKFVPWHIPITGGGDWCRVSSGGRHVTAIKKDGSLWSWGYNGNYELGNGFSIGMCSPVREFSSSNTWCNVSAGGFYTAAIKTDGSIWSWGINSCGNLGDTTTSVRCAPTREASLSNNWCNVSAGNGHTAAIKIDGSIWSWGNNGCGQLGDNTIVSKSSPVRETSLSNNWCNVSAGSGHTAAIKTDGSLWSWGQNNCGNLGDNSATTKTSPVREASLSNNWFSVSAALFSAAIKKDGSLWVWGGVSGYPIGDGASVIRSSPVREATSSNNWLSVCTDKLGLPTVGTTIPAALALKQDGTMWGWGFDCGQLFHGNNCDYSIPTQEYSKSNNWCAVSVGGFVGVAIKKEVGGYCL